MDISAITFLQILLIEFHFAFVPTEEVRRGSRGKEQEDEEAGRREETRVCGPQEAGRRHRPRLLPQVARLLPA